MRDIRLISRVVRVDAYAMRIHMPDDWHASCFACPDVRPPEPARGSIERAAPRCVERTAVRAEHDPAVSRFAHPFPAAAIARPGRRARRRAGNVHPAPAIPELHAGAFAVL